jgi:hypothetical protein
MGNSAVEFRGKGFWARDSDLEFWLRVLVEEIDRLNCPDPWLDELGDHWYRQSQIGGSGIIDFGLDELDEQMTPHQVDQLIVLNKNAMNTIRAFGDKVPLEYLNKTLSPERYYPQDVPTEHYLQFGERFEALLNGTLVADTSLGIYDHGINRSS